MVSNVLEFCPTSSSGSIRFLFSSEESGYRHLYWAETRLPSEGAPPTPRPPSTALTCGNWIVFDSEVCVNWKERVLFFSGNASSCLDKHLYAVQLDAKLPCSSPQQLTSSNYYHTVLMNTECTKFVDTYSNPKQGSSVAVFSVLYQPLRASQLCVIWEPVALPLGHCSPHFFSLHCETGEELHGCVFPPANLIDGHKYPTVHFVYGGPHFQMVSRSLCRFTSRIQTWTEKGFAVVIADNRGSNHRGVHFESAIARQFGKVEVEDQVLALKAAAQAVDYIDLNRVAVTGWSYGGYMSLMCLANAPSVYKLAIAGAAVVDWMSYDTGYTERYIGVPPEAEQAYTQSSVLTCVHQLPTEPNRLLVIHGMNDENVLFTHTSLLLDHLVKFGKPYALQVFTGERHGIRTSLASTHCDATILLFLLQHL
eukprot:Em0010g886a